MKNVIVIQEVDQEDKIVIGVASNREKALELIDEYYGEYNTEEFLDIRKDNIDFVAKIVVEGYLGGTYEVIGECFSIDSI